MYKVYILQVSVLYHKQDSWVSYIIAHYLHHLLNIY